MLRGEVIRDGWASEAVKDALEWCLGCKGCASDCPTHTDMAAYKAEFLSHYYETHLRLLRAPLLRLRHADVGAPQPAAPLGRARWRCARRGARARLPVGVPQGARPALPE